MIGRPYKTAMKQIRQMRKATPTKEFRVGRLDGLYIPQIFILGEWSNLKIVGKNR